MKENSPEDDSTAPSTESDKNKNSENEKNKAILQMPNDSLWNYLVFKEGGCLTGGQNVYKGEFGNEGCVMSNSKKWNIFFNRDKKLITHFLIEKITDDTTKTLIHACPFEKATEGEVAVYGLQNIYKTNWYDFDEFKEFRNREPDNLNETEPETEQSKLQRILKDKRKRELLISCWKRKASE